MNGYRTKTEKITTVSVSVTEDEIKELQLSDNEKEYTGTVEALVSLIINAAKDDI